MKREEIENWSNSLDFSKLFLKNYNGLLVTEEEVDILNRYNIDIASCASLTELLWLIDEVIEDSFTEVDDLEWVAQTIQERNYYENTNK